MKRHGLWILSKAYKPKPWIKPLDVYPVDVEVQRVVRCWVALESRGVNRADS